jgi:hypothetical protein
MVGRRRVAAQRLGARAMPGGEAELVSWLGAVQAQDYAASLWALGARAQGTTVTDVEAALADGTIVRTWALRGTIHLVAAADLRWIVGLAGARSIARAAGRFRQLGLVGATLARARDVVLRAVARGTPVLRLDLMRALDDAGISPQNQRGVHVLWRLAHEGLICFGPKQGKQETFILVDAWVRAARSPASSGLPALALRYFTSHGPATDADFAWWSGLSLGEARSAVEQVRPELVAEKHEEVTYWRSAGRLPPTRRTAAFLLPVFDELLVGYDDRRAVVAPPYHGRVHRGGLLGPIAVIDGRAIATWRRTLSRRGLSVTIDPFEPLGSGPRAAIDRAAERYANFLSLPLAAVSLAPST